MYKSHKQVEKAMVLLGYRALIFVKNGQMGQHVKAKVTSVAERFATVQNTEDKREKIQALSLAKECYSKKLELLTNATVVDDAIRFVSSNKSKEKLKPTVTNDSEYDKEDQKNLIMMKTRSAR
jgi:hypothetical protein